MEQWKTNGSMGDVFHAWAREGMNPLPPKKRTTTPPYIMEKEGTQRRKQNIV
jgi:hypothetical protein